MGEPTGAVGRTVSYSPFLTASLPEPDSIDPEPVKDVVRIDYATPSPPHTRREEQGAPRGLGLPVGVQTALVRTGSVYLGYCFEPNHFSDGVPEGESRTENFQGGLSGFLLSAFVLSTQTPQKSLRPNCVLRRINLNVALKVVQKLTAGLSQTPHALDHWFKHSWD